MTTDPFNRADIILWLSKRLNDPEKVRAIEADLESGKDSRVSLLLQEMRSKRRQLEDRINSGEMSRLVAQRIARRSTESEGEQESELARKVFYARPLASAGTDRIMASEQSLAEAEADSEVGDFVENRENKTKRFRQWWGVRRNPLLERASTTEQLLESGSAEALGYRFVDFLLVTGVASVLIVLLLPQLQKAREAARRAQCTNQLQQLAIAAINYESVNGCLPPGQFTSQRNSDNAQREGGSVLVRIQPYAEGQTNFNHFNFSFSSGSAQNVTVAGMRLSTLWCPSDPNVSVSKPIDVVAYVLPPGIWTQSYSSYSACQGTWSLRIRKADNGFAARVASMNGVIYGHSTTSIASITDGTSNTVMFAEHGHSLLDRTVVDHYHWWNLGYYADTMFEGYYPLNMHKRNPGTVWQIGGYDFYAMNASSFHPGGANFAFVDGSVRFIKDTITSWPIINGESPSVTYDSKQRVYSLVPGQPVGVYQALMTRSGGEVIPPDSF